MVGEFWKSLKRLVILVVRSLITFRFQRSRARGPSCSLWASRRVKVEMVVVMDHHHHHLNLYTQ